MIVSIYGLFHGRRCLYVGRSRFPGARERAHVYQFRKLHGITPKFKILKRVLSRRAAIVEREAIAEYRVRGQAEYNFNSVPRGVHKAFAMSEDELIAMRRYCDDNDVSRHEVVNRAFAAFLPVKYIREARRQLSRSPAVTLERNGRAGWEWVANKNGARR